MPSLVLGQHRRRSWRRRGGRARACACRPRAGPGLRSPPCPRSRSARPRPTARSTRRGSAGAPSSWSISTSSVEPPPMSKISAGPSPGSSSLWQPSTASRASSCGAMMSSAMPVSSRTRSAKSRPLTARRQASVATERDSETLRRRSLSAQTPSAATARSIASSDELAGLRQAFAQPDDAREGVDDGEAAVGRAGDQQAAIVGAEVDRAIGVAMRAPASAAALVPTARPARRNPAAGPAHWRHPAP